MMRSDENEPDQPGLWDQPMEQSFAGRRPHGRRPRAPAGPESPPTAGRAERLWTIGDVAAFLVVPRKTVYSWRATGKGPKGFRVGKHLRWHRHTVVEWSLRQEDEQ
jgi:predicted DNA-binding transcriptional regulator AlpA